MSEDGLPEPGSPGERTTIPSAVNWAVIGGALIAVFVALFVFSGGSGSQPAAPGAATGTTTAPVPTPVPSPTVQPTAVPATIGDRAMLDIGPLLRAAGSNPGSGVLATSVREALVVVELGEAAVIRLDATPPASWQVGGGSSLSAILGATVNGRHLRMVVLAGDGDTRLLHGLDNGVGVYSQDPDGRPVLLLYVEDEAGRPYHAELSVDGRLYVAPEAVPGEVVLEYWSGERLDVAGADKLGTLRSPQPSSLARYGSYWNDCQGGRCVTIWRGGLLSLPQAGRLTCADDGAWVFAVGRLTLTFGEIVEAPGPRPCSAGFDRDVEAGEFLLPGTAYAISGKESSGDALDVAISVDGTLYAGEIRPRVGCPCRFGGR